MTRTIFTSLALAASLHAANDRDTKVRNDRAALSGDSSWVYNDLDKGLAAARRTGKPLMVVFRCIP